MANLKITLRRSIVGFERSQGRTAKALGLTRRGATVIQPDNPAVRGAVFKIQHLLDVVETEEAYVPKVHPTRLRAAKRARYAVSDDILNDIGEGGDGTETDTAPVPNDTNSETVEGNNA